MSLSCDIDLEETCIPARCWFVPDPPLSKVRIYVYNRTTLDLLVIPLRSFVKWRNGSLELITNRSGPNMELCGNLEALPAQASVRLSPLVPNSPIGLTFQSRNSPWPSTAVAEAASERSHD
jgi:hypothetical protein